MTHHEASSLTHEQLVRQVEPSRTRSYYLRNPHVAPVRIGVYPKRRTGDAAIGLPQIPATPPEPVNVAAAVTYADFFRQDTQIAI